LTMLRAGVIGLGVGRRHALAYRNSDLCRLVSVADRNPALTGPFATSSTKVYASGVEMLESEDLDVVSVCTPPSTHCQLTVNALERGIDVLCEKPMAPTVRDCETMIQASRRTGRRLMIGFKKRFEHGYLRLKEEFSSSLDPYMLQFTYVCTGGVRKSWFWSETDGGGPIIENTGHAVDLLRFLLGDVTRVYSEADNYIAKRLGIEQIDSAVFTLRFESGQVADVCAGAWATGPLKRERLIAYCTNGIAEIQGAFDQPDLLKIYRYGGKTVETFNVLCTNPIEREIQAFLECVSSGTDPPIGGIDGMKALEICLAIKESARTGRPIHLKHAD